MLFLFLNIKVLKNTERDEDHRILKELQEKVKMNL